MMVKDIGRIEEVKSMKNDTISKRMAIDEIARWIGYLDDDMIGRIQLGLKRLPSVDRPTGEWIGEADGYADGELVYDTWYCSNCGYVVDDDEPPTWNYCPNCGSYNGGEQSD